MRQLGWYKATAWHWAAQVGGVLAIACLIPMLWQTWQGFLQGVLPVWMLFANIVYRQRQRV